MAGGEVKYNIVINVTVSVHSEYNFTFIVDTFSVCVANGCKCCFACVMTAYHVL